MRDASPGLLLAWKPAEEVVRVEMTDPVQHADHEGEPGFGQVMALRIGRARRLCGYRSIGYFFLADFEATFQRQKHPFLLSTFSRQAQVMGTPWASVGPVGGGGWTGADGRFGRFMAGFGLAGSG